MKACKIKNLRVVAPSPDAFPKVSFVWFSYLCIAANQVNQLFDTLGKLGTLLVQHGWLLVPHASFPCVFPTFSGRFGPLGCHHLMMVMLVPKPLASGRCHLD